MKIKHIIPTALLVSIGIAMVTSTANAVQISALTDDLILSFRATGGTGNAVNLEVDLGNWQTLTASSSFSISLGTDLSAQYGASNTWNTRTDLLWSVVGTDYNNPQGTPDGGVNYNLYFTVPFGGTPDSPQSSSTQQSVAGALNNLRSYLNHKNVNTTVANGLTQASNNATTNPNSYTQLITQQGSTVAPFGYFQNAIENNTNTSLGSVKEELYANIAGSSSPVDLGTFTLSSNGTLTFAQAIPEPSTYALMGLGALALLKFRSRKFNAGLTA